MKRLSIRQTTRAMTLLEVMVVLAVIFIVGAMLIPATSHPRRTSVVPCSTHLRQVVLAFQMYAQDNNGKLPMQISLTNGGTMEFLQRNQTFPHYQKLAREGISLQSLHCPGDTKRFPSTSFETLGDTNLSYFLNADVSTNNPSTSILAGDRDLQANGQAISPGLFILTTNMDVNWTGKLHRNSGVLAFADGHVEICRMKNLNSFVQRQNLAESRLSVP